MIIFNPGRNIVEVEGLLTDTQYSVSTKIDDQSPTAESFGLGLNYVET